MEKENDTEAEEMRVSNKGRRIHYHAGQQQPARATEV